MIDFAAGGLLMRLSTVPLSIVLVILFCIVAVGDTRQLLSKQVPTPQEGDFVLHDFRFKSGETLPEVRMHYYTFGKPVKDANGRTTNAEIGRAHV